MAQTIVQHFGGDLRQNFIAKLGIFEEEADDTLYGLEIIKESGLGDSKIIDPLWKEGNELLSIFIAMIKTAKFNQMEIKVKPGQ